MLLKKTTEALFAKKGQRRQGAFAGAARLLQGQQGEGQGRQLACRLSWQSSVRQVRFESRRECRINHAIQNGGVLYVSNDKEKIREFSDLRRLQLPTRLEISNFRSDVNASTSTNSVSQTSGNVNPSGENISRTSVGLSNICYTFAIKIIGKVLVRRLPVEWRRKIA